MSKPDANKTVETIERFRSTDRKFEVGDLLLLDVIPAASPVPIAHKIFGESGDVFEEQGKVFYRPEFPGTHKILAFEIDCKGTTRKQELRLDVGLGGFSFQSSPPGVSLFEPTKGKIMTHKLEGRWRSFTIEFPNNSLPVVNNDDLFYFNQIDLNTGIITDGFPPNR